MAKPITPDQWIAALRAEGVTDIVEMPGWRTHNRNGMGAWGDVHASMVHHTAGEGAGLADYCYRGNPDLPGPVCHDFLARTGRLYLVGNGRANHAGKVARNAYQAVLNEEATHPAPGPDELDGNAVSYGMEVENSGAPGRAWTTVQYDVAVRVQAARCRFHGWTANSIWAHKEATTRKPLDPRIDMNDFRRDVQERLNHEPGWNPPSKETDVPLTDAEIKKIAAAAADAVWEKAMVSPAAPEAAPRPASAFLRWGDQHTVDILTRIAGLSAAVKALADAGGIDAAGIEAAAEAGARAALAELGERLGGNGS